MNHAVKPIKRREPNGSNGSNAGEGTRVAASQAAAAPDLYTRPLTSAVSDRRLRLTKLSGSVGETARRSMYDLQVRDAGRGALCRRSPSSHFPFITPGSPLYGLRAGRRRAVHAEAESSHPRATIGGNNPTASERTAGRASERTAGQ
ncbi:hypothetical protein EYF80_059616 [Liparis tanakae]|uniref:Uncharacterized protein n=1 Tax=Liparis tanakae TaxID=230148 RepID=A0A4Z2EPH7_9TELE|nr:hypothetical protein EYF80_059616 [Liparis tanakae]